MDLAIFLDELGDAFQLPEIQAFFGPYPLDRPVPAGNLALRVLLIQYPHDE
jgi:hypothetical protein